MKDDEERIEDLLQRNTDEQLSNVDWNKLNRAILNRLDQSRRSKYFAIRYPTVFKVAAGVVVAAAVVVIAVMVRTDTPTTVRFENGAKTTVQFTQSKGTASVEILDVNGQKNQNENRSAWIIIRTRELEVTDNGQSRDEADFACLM
ncbi:MAG: hypothetical protein ACYTBX_08025 [Planctomycetota bacterium]|jgi:hypothetical protein